MPCPLRYLIPVCAIASGLLTMDFCWLSYLALVDSLFTGLLGLCLILGLCTKVNDMAYILLFGQSWLTQGMLGGFLFLLAVVRFKVANEYWHVKERIKIS